MDIEISLDLVEQSTLNKFQKETLTSFLTINESTSIGYSDPEATKPLEEMNAEEVRETLLRAVMHINIGRLDEEHKQRIEKGGFTVQCVTSDPALVYTVGLSIDTGIELACQASIDMKILYQVVNEAALVIKEKGLVEEMVSAQYKVGEENLRVKLVLVENKDKLVDNVTLGMGNSKWLDKRPESIYQVFVGDEGNKLPGEEGYNERFVQEFIYS